jgi:hypothetical protein
MKAETKRVELDGMNTEMSIFYVTIHLYLNTTSIVNTHLVTFT